MLRVYKTKLFKKNIFTENVYLFNLKLIDPPEINFTAGQYLILNVPQEDKEPVKRLYSIASPSQQKNSLELIVEIVPGGAGSTYLNNLKIGDKCNFEGPAGVFILRESENDKVFLATGTGIAPIYSIIKSKIKNQKSKSQIKYEKSSLFWGLRHFKDVYLLEELKELTKEQPNFQFKICLSREENLNIIPEQDRQYFSLGHVNKEIDGLCCTFQVPGLVLNKLDFYICGGREVVESLKQCLIKKGAAQENIYFEKF